MFFSDTFQVNLSIYQARQLPQNWIDELIQKKGFKLFLPANLGGLQMSLPDGLVLLIESAAIQGSLGWCVNLGNGAAYFYRFLDEETSRSIFSPANTILAGSGQETGRAVKTDGGYKVTGTWDRCSGAAHASHFTANVVFEDGKVHSIIIPKADVKLEDTWTNFAMKASSSCSIILHEVFVPESALFDISIPLQHDSYPISLMPFEMFARFCMMATALGTAYCFLNHYEREFQHKLRTLDTDFNQFKTKLESDKSSLLQLAARYWSILESESEFNQHHALNLERGVALMARSIFDSASNLWYKTGIGITNENLLTHQAYKDLVMASQHGLLRGH